MTRLDRLQGARVAPAAPPAAGGARSLQAALGVPSPGSHDTRAAHPEMKNSPRAAATAGGVTEEDPSMEETVPEDRYRVVLIDAGGQCAGWLSPRLRLVNAAWEAGEFTWTEANDFRIWARKHIRRGLQACTWQVVPASPDRAVAS